MTPAAAGFAGLVVRWQKTHGRSRLPWQATRDPYRVWLSEIMLQQTQVATVLAYYPRFLARFPEVRSLADGSLDDVLALWSGLGYYSRARNLHRCAREVMALHGGRFPDRAAALEKLPGIGRSTAAAIAAFCFDERAAILDGNVKRVLTRVLGFDADLARSANQQALWVQATALLPAKGDAMPAYTQGLMDLGATVCLPRQPLCLVCPVRELCSARLEGAPGRYPVKSRKIRRTAQALWLLRAGAPDGAVWLVKRPLKGIWAGLYCLPVFETRDALVAALPEDTRASVRDESSFVHVLTHKDLHLHPVAAQQVQREAMRSGEGAWFTAGEWPSLGLPAPVRKLLEQG